MSKHCIHYYLSRQYCFDSSANLRGRGIGLGLVPLIYKASVVQQHFNWFRLDSDGAHKVHKCNKSMWIQRAICKRPDNV